MEDTHSIEYLEYLQRYYAIGTHIRKNFHTKIVERPWFTQKDLEVYEKCQYVLKVHPCSDSLCIVHMSIPEIDFIVGGYLYTADYGWTLAEETVDGFQPVSIV